MMVSLAELKAGAVLISTSLVFISLSFLEKRGMILASILAIKDASF